MIGKLLATALAAVTFAAPAESHQPPTREPLLVTLTFDDSTRDHITAAAPELERRGWHGMFNVITDWIGRKGDAKGGGAQLTWDDCKALVARGHRVNSHTVHHVNLKKMIVDGKVEEARQEIVGSRDAITKNVGVAPKYLCHPFVELSVETDRLITEAGMIPMTDLRIGFGKPNKPGTEKSFGAILDKWYAEGVAMRDMMFHGIDKDIGVWKPFDNLEEWTAGLDELKDRERRGLVKVLNYDDFYAEALRRGLTLKIGK